MSGSPSALRPAADLTPTTIHLQEPQLNNTMQNSSKSPISNNITTLRDFNIHEPNSKRIVANVTQF